MLPARPMPCVAGLYACWPSLRNETFQRNTSVAFKNTFHCSGHCFSFQCCVISDHKLSGMKQHQLLPYSSYRSEVQAQHSWSLTSSHASEIKWLQSFVLIWSSRSFSTLIHVIQIIWFLAVGGLLFLLSCYLLSGDLSQLIQVVLMSYLCGSYNMAPSLMPAGGSLEAKMGSRM